jgi:hypothetical protein
MDQFFPLGLPQEERYIREFAADIYLTALANGVRLEARTALDDASEILTGQISDALNKLNQLQEINNSDDRGNTNLRPEVR